MNSSSPTIEITERSVNEHRPSERSVRTHNRAQEQKLTRIIRKHGIVAPIIVDPNGNIIDGALVWKLCKKLGFDSVPTVVVRTNDPAAIKALRLALNRVAEDHDGSLKMLLHRSRLFFEDLPAVRRRRESGDHSEVLTEESRGKRPATIPRISISSRAVG